MAELRLYRIRDDFGDGGDLGYDDLVDLTGRQAVSHGPLETPDFGAKFYVWRYMRADPQWAPFLREGFGDDLQLGQLSGVSALLLICTKEPHHYYAVTFGYGRSALRDGSWVPDFGLRTAFNLMYPADGEVDPSQLRAVDRKRVGANTSMTRTQVARLASMDLFDVDRLRDMIRRVTGRPHDGKMWGSRVDGGDALTVTAEIEFGLLGTTCLTLDEAYSRDDYKKRFAFIDNVRGGLQKATRESVQAAILKTLRAGDPEGRFELAPPEILDWERVAKFQFPADRRNEMTRTEFRLPAYLASLSTTRRAQISRSLLSAHRLYALDGGGNDVDEWPIWRCLTGSIDVGGKTYVLDGGEIYEVAGSFMEELDQVINAIQPWDVQLPPFPSGAVERAYNKHAAELNDDLALMDRKTIAAARAVSPIELCDLLSSSGAFIHVKRHFTSAGLSHLFNQGAVAAETMHLDVPFRQRVAQFIEERAGAAHAAVVAAQPFAPDQCTVVYAIVGPWQERPLVEALPFFSKITLRHAFDDLRSMGYEVRYASIELAVE